MEHEHAALIPFVQAVQVEEQLHGSLRVLESGCGEGVNLVHLRQLGLSPERYELHGIDMSTEAVAEAKRRGLPVESGDGLALPYADASFDVSYCRDVLHHLADDSERRKFFHEMWRVTKPGGLVGAIEPNPRNPGILALSYLVPAERGLLSMTEEHIQELLPGARVSRVAPSSVWRVLYHYRSPLRAIPLFAKVTRALSAAWDRLCSRGPGTMWSYRVYLWKKPERVSS